MRLTATMRSSTATMRSTAIPLFQQQSRYFNSNHAFNSNPAISTATPLPSRLDQDDNTVNHFMID
jgi:hypothetical protein